MNIKLNGTTIDKPSIIDWEVSSRRGEEREKKNRSPQLSTIIYHVSQSNRDRNEEKRVAERGFIRDLRGRLIVSMEAEQRSVSLTRDGVDLPSTIMCDQVDTLSIFNEEERRVEVRRELDFYYWKSWYSVASFHYYLLSKVFITVKGSFTLEINWGSTNNFNNKKIFFTHYLCLIFYIFRFKEIFCTCVKFQINEWQSNID